MTNNNTNCEREPKVVEALKTGLQIEEISEHLKICADCRQTAKFVQFFQIVSANAQPRKNLPAAGFIRWKSQLQKKREASEKIRRSLMIPQAIAVGFVLILLIALLIFKPAILSPIENVISQTLEVVGQFAALLFFLIIAVATISAGLFYTANRSFNEKQ